MADTIKSISTPQVHSQTVVNPDGSNIGDALPTSGSNPSLSITETTIGFETTTIISKVVSGETYTKTVVENSSTGITTVSSWV